MCQHKVATFWPSGITEMSNQAQAVAKNSFTTRASCRFPNIHAHNILSFMLGAAVAGQGMGGLKGMFTRLPERGTDVAHMYVENGIRYQCNCIVTRLHEEQCVYGVLPFFMQQQFVPQGCTSTRMFLARALIRMWDIIMIITHRQDIVASSTGIHNM